MNSDAYMILAAAMRYVFFFIVAFILLRLFVLSLREWRVGAKTRRKRRNVQIGYICILTPERLAGERYRLYRETTVGKSRSCDISVPVKSLKGKHAIIFERGGDMYITACYPARHGVTVNGGSIGRGDRRLLDGFTVEMEELTFSVHLEETDEYEADYDSGEWADDEWEENTDAEAEELEDPFEDDWVDL